MEVAAQQLVDSQRAAEILGIKPQTLAVWRSNHRYGIPFHKVGSKVRYKVADLQRWLDSRRVTPSVVNA
ncbi:MAG: helix-turn-helix domain-containing protein [Gammaproteobacteria bacterium]